MNTNPNAQSNPAQPDFPRITGGSYSGYPLDFDEFAAPRTIPANWDLSGLMSAISRDNFTGSRPAGEDSLQGHLESFDNE